MFRQVFRGRLIQASTTSTDFLLDVWTAASSTRATRRHTFENGFAFYLQDSFRVTPRLTLNYGLRWDYFGVVGEKNNLLSNITS